MQVRGSGKPAQRESETRKPLCPQSDTFFPLPKARPMNESADDTSNGNPTLTKQLVVIALL